MLGKIHEEFRTESVYSAGSASKISTGHTRRRSKEPSSLLAVAPKNPGISEVRQRVLSARMLRFKSMQNQLVVAQNEIHHLEQENRSLKTTVRRQEKALEKYDNANAELPSLLRGHQEEIRVWQEKSRVLHKTINELTAKNKQKDTTLLAAMDQNKYFQKLNKDRHLEDRLKLTEQVKELSQRLSDAEKELQLWARKHQLETKMLKAHLQQEQNKSRDLQKKLDAANVEITRLNLLELDTNGRGMRYRNLRETHSAATNISYRTGGPNRHLKVPSSCSESFYSKSPQCDSFRNEILYEDPENEEELSSEQKLVEFEKQKRFHLQQLRINSLEQNTDKEIPPESHEEDLIFQCQGLNRKDILEKETILDAVCEAIVAEDVPVTATVKEETPSHSSDRSQKKPIDQKNKKKLLAALKAIDDSSSFES